MSRIYDLHCHSDQSDGILSPEALVSRAKSKDVSVLALTDHDTTNGVARASRQAALEDLEFISGIEFSSLWQNRCLHIVGLNIDLRSKALHGAIRRQSELRKTRAQIIADRLVNLGVIGALEGAGALAQQGVIGRPHFAAYLVEKGYCRSLKQAFKKYLGAGKIGDVKQMWPDMAEIVQIILRSGGIAVLAHPGKYNMTRTKLYAMVEEFKRVGGQALEVISGTQQDSLTLELAKIAARFELSASCGSDFHSPVNTWQELGRFSSMPANLRPVWSHWE